MTRLITDFLDFIMNYFNQIIPTYDFDPETYSLLSNSLTNVVKFLTDINFIIPLGDIITIIVLSIVLRLTKFAIFAGNWVIRRIFDIIP